MLSIALKYLSVFPVWIQQPVLILSGLVLIAALTASLVKIVLTPSMQKFFRTLSSWSTHLGTYLKEQMDDPTRKPGESRAIQYVDIAMTYLLLSLILSIVPLFGLGLVIYHSSISVVQIFVMFGVMILCFIMARVLKAQGGRQRQKLRVSAKA